MDQATQTRPVTASASTALSGRLRVAVDAAATRLALLLGAVAPGTTRIEGLQATAARDAMLRAFGQFGARATIDAGGGVVVEGVGNGCLLQPAQPVDLRDAPLMAPLLVGLAGAYDMETRILGGGGVLATAPDALLEPLRQAGIQAHLDATGLLTLHGPRTAAPGSHVLATFDSGLKAAVLLAGLNTPGTTTVIEETPTSDQAERMLKAFGARLDMTMDGDGRRIVRLEGQPPLRPASIALPGDPSLAGVAFVAASIVPGSDVIVEDVLANPSRGGLVATLLEMGARVESVRRTTAGGDEVAEIRVRSSELRGVVVPPKRLATMEGDLPALAVSAAFADGQTTIGGLAAALLSRQAAAIGAALAANGVECICDDDRLTITGTPDGVGLGGGTVDANGDGGLARAMLAMGLATHRAVTVEDGASVTAGFADFVDAMRGIGADIE